MRRTVSFTRQAVNVFFHILTRCNLACSHCYINPAQHGKKSLSLGTIGRWLRAFIREDRQMDLIFLGGEPTLHPGLSAAVKSARQMGYGSITVDTNGYLFHDILDKVTPEEVDFFSFSLDGASKATNDRIRGKGSFDACVAGIEKAVSKGFHTSLIYTVSRETFGDLEDMVPLINRLGVRRFFIQVIGRRGRMAAGGKKDVQVGRDQWMSSVPAVAEKIARALEVTDYHSELLPEDKVRIIREFHNKYDLVAMVGDGVNDAPSLAIADIGVAMGTGSADAALDTADIILMKDDLSKLDYLKNLSQKTVRIIKQNIIIALGLKFIFLLLYFNFFIW